ncbi:hypothetical protein [Geminisphaera colitermitum]|uniref:hypothetical protein n=1 Tax=Geminisphaera colitermitum TaxID=1148786 RepID=UPI000158D3CF|nr:hypothetical protein [Geminisphaera colitermitum]
MNDTPYPTLPESPKASWHIGALRVTSVLILVAGMIGVFICINGILLKEMEAAVNHLGYALAIAFGSWVWFIMLRAIAHVIERLDR